MMTHLEWMKNLQLKYNKSNCGYNQYLWDTINNKENLKTFIMNNYSSSHIQLIYMLVTR